MLIRRPQINGFTLIESLIIVAVLGVLSVVVVPSFSNLLDGIRLSQAVTEVRLVLSNAQRQAIRERDICTADIITNKYSTSGNKEMPSALYADCLAEEEENFSRDVIIATNMLPDSFSSAGSGSGPLSSGTLEPDPYPAVATPYFSGSLGQDKSLYGFSGSDLVAHHTENESSSTRSSSPSSSGRWSDEPTEQNVTGAIDEQLQRRIQLGVQNWCDEHEGNGYEYWSAICRSSSASVDQDPKIAQVAFGKNGNIMFGIRSRLVVPKDPSGKLIFFTRDKQDVAQKCIVISRRLGLTRGGTYRGDLNHKDITDGNCTASDWRQQT
ncbi:MAG: prepilin-type N-terminal cleavage/methylation domain-containing protein [Cyanobacteria bacterium P01_F01_bin.42]